MDSSPPGSSVHRILQARILEDRQGLSLWRLYKAFGVFSGFDGNLVFAKLMLVIIWRLEQKGVLSIKNAFSEDSRETYRQHLKQARVLFVFQIRILKVSVHPSGVQGCHQGDRFPPLPCAPSLACGFYLLAAMQWFHFGISWPLFWKEVAGEQSVVFSLFFPKKLVSKLYLGLSWVFLFG